MRITFLVIFVLSVIIPIGVTDAFGEWYDADWEHRNKITVSLNSVISNELTDFPVLISLTDSDFTQAKSDGSDFVFTSSDGTTVLDHEIEKFDSSTGEIIAWVNFPTLPSSSATDIYIYYKGNTSSVNSEDVWNDDYVVVWHLDQTSTGVSGEFKDSTSNGNDGRGGGGTDVGYNSARIPHITDGQIGNGQHLKGPTTTGSGEGTGDIIYRNSLDGMPSRDFTIELWVGDIVNVPSGGNVALYNDMVSVCYDHPSDVNSKWSNHISLWRAENVKMKIRTSFFVSTTSPGHPVQDDNPAAFTNWNHIVAVYNQKDADGTAGNSQLYINGELVKDENRSGGLNRATQTDNLRLVLGGVIDSSGGNNCANVNNELKGKVDEFRISSGLRTGDYAAASYYNQGNPSAYLTLATQENVDTTSPTTVITSSSGSNDSTVSDTTLNYTVTFSESVSNFVVGDITVTGTANDGSPTASNFAGSGDTYTFDVVSGSSDGTVIVSVAAGTATDASNNDNLVSNEHTLIIHTKKSSICYDCEAPKLTKVEVHITSQNSDTQRISTSSEIWHFDQKSPYPIFDDDITPIVADPGDEVQIILELTDNRILKRISDSGTYTNFLHKPNDMNNFYANNFDEYGKVSTTFYEWHNTGEDLFYDYDQTVEWSPADVVIEEFAEYVEGGQAPNLDGLVGTFTISFKMKFLQPMQTTDVWVQGTDMSGNFFKVALPLTLKVAGNEPLFFESKINQKVLGFYDESMLIDVVSDWTGSSKDVSELAEILGIADEQLPSWVTNLAVWVSEDKISMGDMIVSIEHLINN